ncbi:MAG: STAS domain-containing protein [Verrucomicrobiota bacterium]
MNSKSLILAGQWTDRGVVWLRVNGKGSFQNSPQLRDFALQMLEKGEKHFVIDLESCPVMDSTFMGTLTGIARRLFAVENGKLEVINANTRNTQLIQSLGLDQIFDLDTEGTHWTDEREAVSRQLGEKLEPKDLSKRERTELVLEAHQELSDADASNVPRFNDVIEYLHKELEEAG